MLHGMGDLSSPTQDQTLIPSIAWWILNPWTTREVPVLLLSLCTSNQHSTTISLISRKDTGLPWWLSSKESDCNAGDPASVPGSGRSPGEGNGNPLQSSGLGHPMDRGAWWATVHGVAKSWTRLSNFTFTFSFTFIPHNMGFPGGSVSVSLSASAGDAID